MLPVAPTGEFSGAYGCNLHDSHQPLDRLVISDYSLPLDFSRDFGRAVIWKLSVNFIYLFSQENFFFARRFWLVVISGSAYREQLALSFD